LESKPRVIATVINDVIYDQRMIRICTSLSKKYDVELWGRKKSNEKTKTQAFTQRRFTFWVSSGPLFYLEYNIYVFWALLFTKFDAVHAVDLDTLPAAFFASKIKGKKLIYDSHEYFTEVPELISRPGKRKVWLAIEQFLLPKVSTAITVGSKIAEEYEKKYGVKFHVVRNCPTKKPMPPSISAKPYLLYQGALNKGRGLEALVGAMPEIELQLKIAGSGDIEEELKTQVRDLGITHKVSFLGMMDPADLPPLTVSAFAGINVSENLGLSYFYSLNNKYFDYVHAGLPAITNPFPEYMALEEKYQCSVYATASSLEIVKAVNLLLNDSDLYVKLKKNCVLAAQDLVWSNEEKTLLTVYEDIV
jgi:glycosyltransferase involved in cell wall biosynthesis